MTIPFRTMVDPVFKRSRGVRRIRFKNAQQLVNKPDLPLYDPFPGGFDGKPFHPVDFGEFLLLARLGGPLQRECITFGLLCVQVSFKSPGVNQLAAWLLDCAEPDEIAGGQKACLFFKLAPRRFQRIFILAELSLGNRPGAKILLCLEGTSRMYQ
jgi:hypothetical protein